MFTGSFDPQCVDGNAIHPTSELDGLSGGKIVRENDAFGSFLEWAWRPLQNAGQRVPAFVLVIPGSFERVLARDAGQIPVSVGSRRLIR
jgi:hypothetical protein